MTNQVTPWNKGKKQSDIIGTTLKAKWKKNSTLKCSQCRKTITYNTYEGYWYAVKKGRRCRNCSLSGDKNPQWGVRHNKSYKDKMSERLSGKNNPMYGKLGKRHPAFGYKHTKKTKELIRKKVCERMLKTGGVPDVDVGSTEYFDRMNLLGHNIQHPNVYFPCGYFVDGYDADSHIVYEYDTVYHRKPSRKKKDKERQKNIIKYFTEIGCPLKGFVRIKAYNNHEHENQIKIV